MTTRSVWCGRIVLAVAAAWLSARGGVDAWIIGAAFGLVILAWTATRPRQLASLGSVAFALCSALVCELVSRIALSGSFNASRWGGNNRMALAVAGIALTSLACTVVVPRVGSLTLGALAVVWQTAYLVFFFTPTPQPRPAFSAE